MRVEINGETHELPEGSSLGDAALAIGINPGRGIAIALDGVVVPMRDIELTLLRDGQRVEVVAAIGGGGR